MPILNIHAIRGPREFRAFAGEHASITWREHLGLVLILEAEVGGVPATVLLEVETDEDFVRGVEAVGCVAARATGEYARVEEDGAADGVTAGEAVGGDAAGAAVCPVERGRRAATDIRPWDRTGDVRSREDGDDGELGHGYGEDRGTDERVLPFHDFGWLSFLAISGRMAQGRAVFCVRWR